MSPTPANAEPVLITGAAALLPDPGDRPAERRVKHLEAPARFPPAALRKLSRLGRMALAVFEPALAEAGLSPGPELGLVVGTGLADLDETAGFLDGLHQRGEGFASPQHFQRSVHGAVAGELAILYGLTGYQMTVTQGLASGEAALYRALLAIRAGRCDACVAVAVDGLSESLLAGLRALGAPGPAGEGAAALVLERASSRAHAASLASLASVDPVASGRPAEAIQALGLHGALGLVRAALALRAPGFAGCPETVRLAAPERRAIA